MKRGSLLVVGMYASVTTLAAAAAQAQEVRGAIVGWGTQVVGVDLSSGFTAVAAGSRHSVGLKGDGSVVLWGDNSLDQCDGPEPNMEFIAVAARYHYSIGLRTAPSRRGDGMPAKRALCPSRTRTSSQSRRATRMLLP
jgi:hypothetical protein